MNGVPTGWPDRFIAVHQPDLTGKRAGIRPALPRIGMDFPGEIHQPI